MIDRRHLMTRSAGVLSLLALPSIAFAQDAPSPVIDTPYGKLRGRQGAGVLRFLGVPYAEAKVRFQRATSVKWTGVREAVALGPIAPQPMDGPTDRNAVQSENCQVLNIFTPAADGARRPVMFWCHGGGFQSGSAGADPLHGAALARTQNVVVVSINHRLGVIGSLKLDHLDPRYKDSGTAGMLDIVDALIWVNKSIAAFGGDPNNVTIFGQSGGGGKVLTLLTMPEACKYFHRAICHSGSMKQTSQTPENGRDSTARLLRAMNLSERDAAGLAAAPLDAILKAQSAEMLGPQPGMRPFSPVVDGKNLPEQPFGDKSPECSKHIPLMIGSTTEELRVFNQQRPELFKLDEAGIKKELQADLDARTDSVVATYRAARPNDSWTDIYFAITAANFYWAGSLDVAEKKYATVSSGGAPVYMFRYSYDPNRATRGEKPSAGAGHGQEMAYVFARVGEDRGPAAYTMGQQISTAWATFARTGKPAAPGIGSWGPYDTTTRQTLIMEPPAHVASDPDRAERLWWKANWRTAVPAAALLPGLEPHHFSVSVPNLDQAIEWYSSILGFTLEQRYEVAAIPAKGAFLRRDQLRIELWQAGAGATVPKERREPNSDLKSGGTKHIAFAVPNLQARIPALIAANVDIAAVQRDPTEPMKYEANPLQSPRPAFSIFIRDPFGTLIELLDQGMVSAMATARPASAAGAR